MSGYRNNLNNMMCLDVFVSSLSEESYKAILSRIKSRKGNRHPLMSYGISAKLNKNAVGKPEDLEVLNTYKNLFNWNVNLEEILENDYQALVLTNKDQIIEWANEGFFPMTGYKPEQALGKTPGFLQGKETNAETKKSILQKLPSSKPFTELILNYKANKTPYLCKISIFPLKGKENETIHYLALEKEID